MMKRSEVRGQVSGVGQQPFRSGTTLTEVLISLLAMSVGVVAAASLFPLSVLRSVQARQITQATILRYSAESWLRVHQPLLKENKRIESPPMSGNYVVREFPMRPGNHYIVDPLGMHLTGELNTDYRYIFGNNIHNPNTPPATPNYSRIIRTAGGFHDPRVVLSAPTNLGWRTSAATAVSLPDSWILDYMDDEANLTSGANSSAVVSTLSTSDLQSINDIMTSGGDARITVFNFDDSSSRAHQIVNAANLPNPLPARYATINPATNTITLTPAVPFSDSTVRFRFDHFEQQFTWMLTVRNSSSGIPDVDIVTFFRRAFSMEDELIYDQVQFLPFDPGPDGQPGEAGTDDDNNGTKDDISELGWPGTDDHPNRKVVLRWLTDPSLDEKPFFNRGGYIFDISNALWYRIQSIGDEFSDPNFPNHTNVLLKLEDTIQKQGNRGAMVMRGVVEVFPLGSVVVQ